ncbi:MAG TPA: NYN domain-containing protein [Ignavibacteriaceae bacterium]|nr:NYN domain-containing protein [Ignavibacteriaceae bacterium]
MVYIDGFNLYFGLKSKAWKKYYWLNLQKSASNILKVNQVLVLTKYFTSRISDPPAKNQRQKAYIEALETLQNFNIYYGKYQSNSRICKRCGNVELIPNEKMTDVNIAVEMLTDAFENKFDTAILISADSDLTAPISSVLRLFPHKKVILAFPPDRFSYSLKSISSASLTIGRRNFDKSLFPDTVIKKDGFVLRKPERWT